MKTMNDKKMKSQKDLMKTRSNVLPATNGINNQPPSHPVASSLICTDESIIPLKSNTTSVDGDTRMNLESVAFVCFDLPFQSISILYGSLRAINDYIRVFTDLSVCLDWIQSSNSSIFFISSSSERDLITAVHACNTVEAIFILNSNSQVSKNDFPKLTGVFNQHEELFMVLEDMLIWFEQSKLEVFAFEDDKIFLWSQLWKEERINTKITSNKNELVDIARNYYRGNAKALKLIDTFYQSYRSSDAFRWCFRSPFPARSLNHALRFHKSAQLDLYSFLLSDASRVLKQQPKRNTSIQLYRGMKLAAELVDRLEENTGKLICPSGFFICTKSRTAALTLASSPSRRPDLSSVLFKIDCDSSVPFAELSVDGPSVQIVFDVYTSFRIMCVNRGQMSVVKMKTASEEGKQMAKEFKKNHKGENIQNLLNELLIPPKPPTPPSPAKTIPTEISSSTISKDEIQAQEYLTRGEVDLALAAYRRIEPVSSRILNLMGQIYTEKKEDNESAFKCHMQALKIQEEKGEDISDTLTSLGILHCNRREFDLALSCHTRALRLREAVHSPISLPVANSLRGIANVQWARHELSEALKNAERVLHIHQSLIPINETNVATSLATLANIYHDSNDDTRAIELSTQALVLLERCTPINLPVLAALLHNIAAFQLGTGAILEARNSYERALKIYANILPPEHPKRVSIEKHIQHIIQMQNQSTGKTDNGTDK